MGGYGRARPSGGAMPPHLGRAVGSVEGSIPSLHNRAQQEAQLNAHVASCTTVRADVAPHVFSENPTFGPRHVLEPVLPWDRRRPIPREARELLMALKMTASARVASGRRWA